MGGRRITEAEVIAEAAKYQSKKAFDLGCRAAGRGGMIKAARRMGILDQLFTNKQRVPWVEGEVRAEAAKYSSKKEFELGSLIAYRAAVRFGIIDDLGFKPKRICWTEELVRAIAGKYETKAEFERCECAAYAGARKLGLINDLGLVDRMPTDNDTIYIWRAVGQYFNGEPVYKIGVTSERLGIQRIEQVARSAGFKYTLICCEKVVCPATEIEKRLSLLGHDPEFSGIDGATEFRAMSDAVLWVALGLISEVTVRKNHG